MYPEGSAIPERFFTVQQLRIFNGEDHPKIYVAYQGVVYDVTNCPKWRNGIHEQLHFPGQDLTSELVEAPHEEEVFSRPCISPVGRLVSS
jgi:predicted heme/steroid binding protein